MPPGYTPNPGWGKGWGGHRAQIHRAQGTTTPPQRSGTGGRRQRRGHTRKGESGSATAGAGGRRWRRGAPRRQTPTARRARRARRARPGGLPLFFRAARWGIGVCGRPRRVGASRGGRCVCVCGRLCIYCVLHAYEQRPRQECSM